MSESLKNILVGIICLILFGFAYFFLTGGSNEESLNGQSADDQAALLAKTQSFIERSQILKGISIDTAFFNDTAFTSLRSYSTEVPNQPLGKNDIFGTSENISKVKTKIEEEVE